MGLNELFNEGGGRGRGVHDKREVYGIFGKFVGYFIAAVSLVAGDPKKVTEMWDWDARSLLISMVVEAILPVETMEDSTASKSERSSIRLTSE